MKKGVLSLLPSSGILECFGKAHPLLYPSACKHLGMRKGVLSLIKRMPRAELKVSGATCNPWAMSCVFLIYNWAYPLHVNVMYFPKNHTFTKEDKGLEKGLTLYLLYS